MNQNKCFSIIIILLTVVFSFSLIAQTADAPAGDGSGGDPYQIATLNNLYWITQNSTEWDKAYIQTADINASSTSSWDDGDGGLADGLSPIGTSSSPAFTGTYDGQGYIISSLYISRTSTNNVGLFGYTTGATIENLGVTSVSINGQNTVGSIVGYNHSTIINNCYATGGIGGDQGCGGLIGANYTNSSVNRCYADVNVQAEMLAGGFIGSHNNSTIKNCYSLGDVQCTVEGGTPNEFGGFCGKQGNDSDTKIEYCYSIGMVSYLLTDDPTTKGFLGVNNNGTCTANFWNTQTSGQSSTGAASIATGKTTAEMKTASTFLDASWDPAIWNIDDGINDGYPYLDWQNPDGTPLPVELTNFDALLLDESVLLTWETAMEVNNFGFEIERENGKSGEWEKIGFVQGHGTTNSPKQYSFTDPLNLDLNPNLTLINYRLKQIDNDGTFAYSKTITVDLTKITNVDDEIVYEFSLEQNYPNPFNPSTTISFTIPSVETTYRASLHTKLIVYDILGREVTTLVNQNLHPGNHEVVFDAGDFSSGVYLYKLSYGDFIQTKRMLLIK